jgi:hypothetical protein
MSIVDIVLGTLVVGLAGWALVQTGAAKPARGHGCGGGCGSSCSPGERTNEDEPPVAIGGGTEHGSTRDRS